MHNLLITKGACMNGKNTIAMFLIAITCLVSFSCEPGYNRDRDRSDRTEAERSLMGNWYVNGDPDKRAEIVLTAGGLEARNENGDISRLNVERAGEIRALDWMTDATKKRALEKLKDITNKIGYPDHWRDYSSVEVKPSDFFGKYAAAEAGIAAAQKAVSLKPGNAEYHRLLGTLCGQVVPGNVLLAFKYGKCAQDSVNKAVELDPKSAIAYLSRGVGNYYLPAQFGGGPEQAIKDFEKALARGWNGRI